MSFVLQYFCHISIVFYNVWFVFVMGIPIKKVLPKEKDIENEDAGREDVGLPRKALSWRLFTGTCRVTEQLHSRIYHPVYCIFFRTIVNFYPTCFILSSFCLYRFTAAFQKNTTFTMLRKKKKSWKLLFKEVSRSHKLLFYVKVVWEMKISMRMDIYWHG